MPPRTRLDPEVRREQILSAAERVFAGRDPAEVTFEAVAEAAGVSRGLVYNYFGDRGGLLAALYLRSFTALDEQLRNAFSGSRSRGERLRQVIASYLSFAREHRGRSALIWSAEAGSHPAVREARRQRYDRMAQNWGGSPEARMVARGVIGLLETAVDEWINAGATDADDAATEVLHRLLWTGLSSLSDPPFDQPPAPPILTITPS